MASAGGSDLPPEWVEKTDAKTGKVYYYNKKTRETTWKKPAAIAASSARAVESSPPSAASSADWVERKDQQTGKTYYYNKKTRETTWTKPAALTTEIPAPASPSKGTTGSIQIPLQSHPAASALTVASAAALHEAALAQSPDWTKKIEPRTGAVFFYNRKTNERRWIDPITGEASHLFHLHEPIETIFVFGGADNSGTCSTTVTYFDGAEWKSVAQPTMMCPLRSCTAVRCTANSCMVMGARHDTSALCCFEMEFSPTGDGRVTPRTDLVGSLATGAAACCVAHGILLTGGFASMTDKKRVQQDCTLWDLSFQKQHTLPSLCVARASHCMVSIDASGPSRLLWFAFVLGGFDGESKSSSVERYILADGKWDEMSDMLIPRSGHGAAIVDKTIYVFGGRSSYSIVNSGEYMHVQTDIWCPTSPMRQARTCFGIDSVMSYIFVVGGWDGARWLNSVEVYDTRLDVWRDVMSISSPRASLGVCVLNSFIKPKIDSLPAAVIQSS